MVHHTGYQFVRNHTILILVPTPIIQDNVQNNEVSGNVPCINNKNSNLFLSIEDSFKITDYLKQEGYSIPNDIQNVIHLGTHSKL